MVKKLFFFFFSNKVLDAQYKNLFSFYKEQTKEKLSAIGNKLRGVQVYLK